MDHNSSCQLMTVPTYGLCTCDFDQRMLIDKSAAQVDRPIHLKFGYQHMMETREIEAELHAQGLTGTALHFAVVAEREVRHKDDLPYRERQRFARERGEAWAGGVSAETLPTDADILRAALEAVRDGHNDPRALAEAVLKRLK